MNHIMSQVTTIGKYILSTYSIWQQTQAIRQLVNMGFTRGDIRDLGITNAVINHYELCSDAKTEMGALNKTFKDKTEKEHHYQILVNDFVIHTYETMDNAVEFLFCKGFNRDDLKVLNINDADLLDAALNLAEKNRQKAMHYKTLLNSIVNHVAVAENTATQIQTLSNMGFDADDMKEFNYNEDDINDALDSDDET